MIRKAWRPLALLLAAGLTAGITAGCGTSGSNTSDNGKPVLRMGIFPAFRPLQLVKQMKILEKEGYKVEWTDFLKGAPAESAAMASKSIQFMEGDTPGLEEVYAKSPGLIWYIANGSNNYVSIVANKGSGIKSISDLKGHKVCGVAPGTAPTAVLQIALAKENMTLDDVSGINTTGPSQAAALDNGGCDAATTYQPYASSMLLSGKITLLTTAEKVYGGTWPGGGVAVDPDFAKKHKQAVIDVVKAVDKANKLLAAENEQAYKDLATATKSPLDVVKYGYENKLVTPADVAPDKNVLSGQLKDLIKYDVVKINDPDKWLDGFAHPEFAEDALK